MSQNTLFSEDLYIAEQCLSLRSQASQIIGQRSEQADSFVVGKAAVGYLAAVFDGHRAGARELTQQLAAQVLQDHGDCFTRLRWPLDNKTERRVMRQTLARLIRRHRAEHLGSTATVVWVRPTGFVEDTLWVRVHAAVMGDSPVGVWDGRRLRQPRLHSANTCLADTRRIEAFIARQKANTDQRSRYRRSVVHGGYVWLVGPGADDAQGLAMTRAIGDQDLGDLLIRRPEIHSWALPVESLQIVLASDGVLPLMATAQQTRQTMTQLARQLREGEDIHALLKTSAQPSADNATLLDLRFFDEGSTAQRSAQRALSAFWF